MLSWLLAVALLTPTPPPAPVVDLPVYTFTIRNGAYQDGGVLLSSVNYPIPGTIWRCAISYIPSGVVARCTLPGETAAVAVRASCAELRQNSQTLNLSNLDGGYASVMVGCQRLETIDDGF